jgi:hypothetical protein
MSTQEKMIEKLRLDLLKNVEAYFESVDRFEREFILNSRITKDSPFEKNQFCSDFTICNLNELPIGDIMLGDTNEISVLANVRIATSSNIPKRGKELNSWSSSIFGITIKAEVSFNFDTKEIEVSKIDVRNR